MTQIGLFGAFLGGALSLLSPCSAMLLPSFFAYAFDRVGTLMARTTVFLVGLASVLMPLGAGVAAVSSLVTVDRGAVTLVGALVLIVLGVATIFGKGFEVGLAKRVLGRIKIGSWLSVFALGAVYGFAGFCSGPLLGSVLTVSIVGREPVYGALLLGSYAVGMTVPLFVLALLWDRFRLGHRAWLRGRVVVIGPFTLHTTSVLSGLLFTGLGVLFLVTDGTANLGGLAGVDSQFALQAWVQSVVSPELDAVVALVVAVIALVMVALRIRRRARNAGSTMPRTSDMSTDGRPGSNASLNS